jgi:hypothetical protein
MTNVCIHACERSALIVASHRLQVRHKSTHSAQTELSHFRRENICQTFPPKSNATQTTVSTGTNPPKNILSVLHSNYVLPVMLILVVYFDVCSATATGSRLYVTLLQFRAGSTRRGC